MLWPAHGNQAEGPRWYSPEEAEAALVSPPPLDSLPLPRVGAGAEGQSPPPLPRTASPAAAMALLRGAQGRDGPRRDVLSAARP